jgi:protease-4
MALEADLIVDRRRLRRRLTFWRVAGVAAAIVAVLALGALGASRAGLLPATGQHVARVALSGFVTYDRPLIRALERVADNDRARALVLQIDSPGGSVTGSEALYAAIRRVAEKKPVVAVVGTLGASGAYIAALGADHIVSGETSLVGSVGVIVQWADVAQLLRTLGIQFHEVKTSPLKASPNPFEPPSEEARAALRALVGDSYAWFTNLVGTRRRLEGERLREVSDGRVFTGRQAIGLGLVDSLGDERAARAWLARERNVAADLAVRDYRPRRDRLPGFLDVALATVGERLGLPGAWLPQLASAEARLDGLVSVWHPGVDLAR